MQAPAGHSSIQWIAHRGDPHHYPENSIEGFESALDQGALWLECDVQLSADRVPMLFHDADLRRMTGADGSIHQKTADELQQLALSWPDDASSNHAEARIQPLSVLSDCLNQHSHVTVFIELKVESIHHIGHEVYVQTLLKHLKSFSNPVVLISFSSRILEIIRTHTRLPIGWVIPDWTERHHAKAAALHPDWLFCNHLRLPEQASVWSGDWQWGLYAIDDLITAEQLRSRGFHHLETNHIGAMLHAGL